MFKLIIILTIVTASMVGYQSSAPMNAYDDGVKVVMTVENNNQMLKSDSLMADKEKSGFITFKTYPASQYSKQ
ncbi:MAG: hypothetical protein HC906_09255 [Bacteroidales bacterium]|nr:hypothetical protein [Bacteroidales bacterium]